MIIKVCKEDGYEYFECDSLNVGVMAWGNRDIYSRNIKFILLPNIERSEASNIEKETVIPYLLKVLEFNKGEKYNCVITDVLTYLMNDEGKTIDRIN